MPDTQVWAIDGDGCFQMTNQELATCVIEGIPVKIAIINNGSLGMVRQWQTLFYNERYSNNHALERRGGDRRGPVHGAARSCSVCGAGGPIATVVFTIVLVLAAVFVSPGSVSIGLLVAAFLNTLILAVNLLPVAPTDGYALFRSAVWAETGSRAEAERRALAWSRVVLASGLFVAVLVLGIDKLYGVLAVVILVTLTVQHHVVARRAAENPA